MKCESCGNENDGSYGSGRFCSSKCARGFSGKRENDSSKSQTKQSYCVVCKKEIVVNKRSSEKVYCNECKKYKKCKVCGDQLGTCLRPDICRKYRLFPILSKYFGFDESARGSLRVYEEFDRIYNIIYEDYIDNRLSGENIAKKYSYSGDNFDKILRSLNIPIRNSREATNNAILTGVATPYDKGNLKYKHGWHTTWNNKKIYYRSSYELNYAKQLDEKRIDYDVELLRIIYWDTQLNKQRIAIPDFFILNDNLIVEIKSKWTFDAINMKDKVKSYKEHGHNVKVFVDNKEINLS